MAEVFVSAGTRTRRSTWFWLTGIGVPLFTAWALAGCFMEGEDELEHIIPLMVVLGGDAAGERLQLACQLFSQGHGRQGVVLTGGNVERFVPDRVAYLKRCGVPETLLSNWPTTANSFEEVSAVAKTLAAKPGLQAIVVSDALHMPRLRYLRDKLELNGRVFFRQSRRGWRSDPNYLSSIAVFWFREPLAYVFYRLRY